MPEGYERGLVGCFDIASRDNACTVRLKPWKMSTGRAPDTVNKAMQAFERILGAALPRADSLDFTREMESQWKTRIAQWRKSTYSSNGGGNCVEVASSVPVVLVRDTTNRDGGTLTFTVDAWQRFASGLK